jgi:hypothetical protein
MRSICIKAAAMYALRSSMCMAGLSYPSFFTNLITPWSRMPLEVPTVPQPVKKFHGFMKHGSKPCPQ